MGQVLFLSGQTDAAQNTFPLRLIYPEVPVISTESLADRYDHIIILDIRSKLEYEVARINKAILLPLNDAGFTEELKALADQNRGRYLAFYCNGHTCAKSYKAVQLAISLGLEKVICYDGGIFDWIESHPEKATLLSVTPAKKELIISDAAFEEKRISFDAFKKLADSPNSIVIDIRDSFQRELSPDLPGIRNIPLDPLLELVSNRVWTEKKLLFFDAVGKQVRWLQYYLMHFGYYDFAFLDGGVLAISRNEQYVSEAVRKNDNISGRQESFLEIALNESLSGKDKILLFYLLGKLKFNNYAAVELKLAASETNLSDQAFLSACERLQKERWLLFSELEEMVIFQLNPKLAWKGKTADPFYRQKLKEFNKAFSQTQ